VHWEGKEGVGEVVLTRFGGGRRGRWQRMVVDEGERAQRRRVGGFGGQEIVAKGSSKSSSLN